MRYYQIYFLNFLPTFSVPQDRSEMLYCKCPDSSTVHVEILHPLLEFHRYRLSLPCRNFNNACAEPSLMSHEPIIPAFGTSERTGSSAISKQNTRRTISNSEFGSRFQTYYQYIFVSRSSTNLEPTSSAWTHPAQVISNAPQSLQPSLSCTIPAVDDIGTSEKR